MLAKFTGKHVLFLDKGNGFYSKVVRRRAAMDTWHVGTLAARSKAQTGTGFAVASRLRRFSEEYVQLAYDKSVVLLKAIGDTDGLVPLEELQWV